MLPYSENANDLGVRLLCRHLKYCTVMTANVANVFDSKVLVNTNEIAIGVEQRGKGHATFMGEYCEIESGCDD